MLISSISVNNVNYANYAKPQRINYMAQPSFGAFRFKSDILELRHNFILKKALPKFRNLTIGEYKLLSIKEKQAIRAILKTQNY